MKTVNTIKDHINFYQNELLQTHDEQRVKFLKLTLEQLNEELVTLQNNQSKMLLG